MRIQTKLNLLIIACTLLPLVTVLALSFKSAHQSLSVSVAGNLLSHAEEQLGTLQTKLVSAKHELETFSKLSNMTNVQFGDADGKLQADIDVFTSRLPLFTEILAANKHGRVIASNLQSQLGTYVNGSWEFEAPNLGINFDGRVVKSYRLNRLISTHSVPLINPKSSERIGALIGAVDWEHLQQDLAMKKIFGGSQSIQRQMFLESMESDSILYASPNVEVPWELFKQQSDHASTRRIEHLDRNYIMATIPSKALGGFRDPRWRLHVLLDADIAFASANKLKRYSVLAALMVMALVIFAAAALSRIVVTPVQQLLTGTKRITDGDYDYSLPDTGNKDEIGQLTNRFNTMRKAVKDNQVELIRKTEIAEQSAQFKGQFLANMSHEVRTPINGVLGMTELLLNTPLDQSQTRYAKTIGRSGQTLLSVINDILDFSKIEAGKLLLTESAFDLRDLVEDVVEMVAETAHNKLVEVALQMDPDCPVAFNGDSTRLRQVLINLMSNAVKFTDEGEVRLLVDVTGSETGYANIQFDVIDTGIGISAEFKERIFASFVQADGTATRQHGGTGLGLAISARLANLMGGTIEVESTEGEGSQFTLVVKLEQLSKSVEDAWCTPNALLGKTILVVDDNKTNCEILEGQVRFWGAKPIVANSGLQALEWLAKNTNAVDIPNAALLDMHMPGMNGFELATKIKTDGIAANMQCVLISSAGDLHDQSALNGAGIVSMVHKPVRQQDLYNCLIATMDPKQRALISQKKVVTALDSNKLQGSVLLAEDNRVNQDMMLEMLRLLGLHCVLAGNGQAAITEYQTDQFDLILMDCQMPVLDGFGATEKIRNIEKNTPDTHIPIVALTANAMEGDRERCLNAGMDDYLSKPVNMKQLLETLSQWIPQEESQPATDIATDKLSIIATASNDSNINLPNNNASEEPPQFDKVIFNDVWEMCEQAGNGFYDRLLDTYIESSHEDLKAIAAAIESGNAGDVGSHAHRLKSGTASWGASRMADLCFQLEQAGKTQQLNQAPQLLERITIEHVELQNILDAYRAKAA